MSIRIKAFVGCSFKRPDLRYKRILVFIDVPAFLLEPHGAGKRGPEWEENWLLSYTPCFIVSLLSGVVLDAIIYI